MPTGKLQLTLSPCAAQRANGHSSRLGRIATAGIIALVATACGGSLDPEVAQTEDAIEGDGVGWGGTGTYGGWGGYLGDINDPSSPPSPTGSYTVVERDPRSNSIMGFSVGRDLNGDGRIDHDEFGPTDFNGAMQGDNPVGIVDVDVCCFYGNIPSPIESLGSVTTEANQRALEPYLRAWYTSPLRDKLTDFAYRRVSFKLTTADSPSMFVFGTRTLYISIEDLRTHGIIALDHELMHAGLRLGRAERIMDRASHRKLNQLNIRRFSALDGYVGTIHGNFDPHGFGAAKAFVIGQQYAKLLKVQAQLSSVVAPFASQYLADVRGNLRVGRFANGKWLHLISKRATTDEIDGFLAEFTNRNAATFQEIRTALAGYPAPLQLPYISPLPPPPIVEPR